MADDEEKNDCSKNDEGELDGSTSPMDQEGVNEAGSDEKSVLTDDKAIFSIVQVNTYGADITEIKDKEQQFKFESKIFNLEKKFKQAKLQQLTYFKCIMFNVLDN